VKQWQNPVYKIAYRYFGNEQDARDICQETFIKAHKSLKKLKNHNSFSTWIYRITVNLCKDEYNKRKKRTYFNQNDNDEYENTVSIEAEIEDVLIQKELKNIITGAMNCLPVEQKEVLILKEYQNLKFREIADILKIPISTVKSRMYYALKNMKKKLKKLKLDKEIY